MIHLTKISKQHGARILFKDASFQVPAGTKTGLVGANGSGKTTLFNLITGKEVVDSGEIASSKKIKIGYFSQDVGEMAGCSALAEVMSGAADVMALGDEMKEMEILMAEPMDGTAMDALLEKYGEAVEVFENRGGYDLEPRAQTILTGLGIGPGDYNRPVETFSGGWKMRIALAKILAIQPNLLLLDEPTNHLDVESIVWLENWLVSDFTGALLMTCHDHDFMNRVVDRTIEVANTTITTYGGNYDFYVREREIRMAQLLATHRRQQEMLAKEENFIARFKARVSHAAQVQSRIKKLEKIERIELPEQQRTINFEFSEPPRSGDDVVVMESLEKTWNGQDTEPQTVFSNISGLINRQDKIAVVGVNGAGKSTFLKVLAGRTPATCGSARVGANVNIGYFSQHAMDILESGKTVLETVQAALPQAGLGVIRNLCGAFLFSGDDVEKRIQHLSGGEKSRVVLATLLGRPLNFLILDEPTNHLDIQSRQFLLQALKSFTGTLILVSHDRYFLRCLVDRVFEIDQGKMTAYSGGYDYYLSKAAGIHNLV
ncbi:ABC-type transporter, ATP-binding protein [Desulforapulum autotrophicum HRM2]|uniref:ABC-type transporter, ATP-binding protein n=1 Tax=Desulforapulum autotrophicum (strain ATCC 43914 / DSM 3382 / VKM B-1955 / HRM2) TaxID=177437 RepID=C0QG40_DESAH|nr:ABC-F family ATP-binding cassette domain-containing protein [Desulforapulum autotrophicum]ACN17619.1 ABC-type transporter, ATP-binding protein [Desulforapulum autotrophicum HRM2]